MMAPEAVAKRAGVAARIFDVLAWVVLLVGVLGAVASVIAAYSLDESFMFETWIAVGSVIGVVVYTALVWAGVTLATAVAGYIAIRSRGEVVGPV